MYRCIKKRVWRFACWCELALKVDPHFGYVWILRRGFNYKSLIARKSDHHVNLYGKPERAFCGTRIRTMVALYQDNALKSMGKILWHNGLLNYNSIWLPLCKRNSASSSAGPLCLLTMIELKVALCMKNLINH